MARNRQTKKAFIVSIDSVTVRWSTDMDVWPGCGAMVQMPAIVNRSLSKDGDGKLLMKRVGKESLNLPGVAEIPTAGAGVTRESSRSNQGLLGETQVFCDLLVGCCFHKYARDLRVSVGHLAASFFEFLFLECERMLVLFNLSSRDQTFSEQFLRDRNFLFRFFNVRFVNRKQLLETRFVVVGSLDVFFAELCQFTLRRLLRRRLLLRPPLRSNVNGQHGEKQQSNN